MQNIEIKARFLDLSKAKLIAEKIGATFEGTQVQIDTYFNVKNGRLKLRESSTLGAQLIYYERPDESGLKKSEYHIYPVSNASQLKLILASALGVWRVVEKQREVYWLEEVRIHLDEVKNMGNFVEFEGVILEDCNEAKVRAKVESLISHFQIPKLDFINFSYSDFDHLKIP